MMNITFLIFFALFCFLYLIWGNRTLPKENWQFIASIPKVRNENGPWEGINLTWYGLFSANAYVVAVALFLLLTGAISTPPSTMIFLTVALLLLCIPASKIVARIV